MIAKGGRRGGMEWKFAISRYKLLYVGCIAPRTIFSILEKNTKKKKNIYIYIYISVTESQHCKSTILQYTFFK